MLHRSAKVKPGQRVLIHGASGGVGTAFLQLGQLAGVEIYGTCSAEAAEVVKELGATPIDYRNSDFVEEIHRLTGDGVDAVFDGIGGDNLWRSREALGESGRVVVYGFQAKLHGGRMASDAPKGRHPIRESAILGWYILRNWFLPGGKGMVPYSIQWLMWVKPAWFRQDLVALLELLQQNKIKPLIAERLPLGQARRAQELLGRGGVIDRADTERVTGLQFARLIVRRWEAAAVCILLPHLRIGILARIPNRSVFGMHLLSSNATKRAPKAYYWQTSSILLPRTGGACA